MSSKSQSKLQERKYNAREREQELFKQWQEEKLYHFDPHKALNSGSPIFTIDTPPPYTNASWHMGSTIHYLTIDMIARMARMDGKVVHFPMGLDRNGLPIEIATEERFNINMHDIDREEFLSKCRQLLDEFGTRVLNMCYRVGMGCNSFEWQQVYRTDDQQYRALTQATFIELWNQGMIYEDDRPNNWDPKLKTTIADAEIKYEEGKHTLYEIAFDIADEDKKYTFATTRPELIPAIRLIVFHPDDQRYQHLEGKIAQVPIWDIEVPIHAHTSADPDFGSGLMQVCSYGDIQDVRTLREMGIDPVYAISLDGRLTEATGVYQGMTIKEGRERIVADLHRIDAITNSKEIPYRFPISDRSDAGVEFIGMPEYYLKQEALVPRLRQYAASMNFHPEEMRQRWIDWLDRISMDWPISRRRYYGTEVPVWYCKNCGHAQVPTPGPYYQPWKDEPPFDSCNVCGNNEFRGDERTFDTWMDSSISPLYISRYPNNLENLELLEHLNSRPYLADLRPQGKDIIRTWLHYTMLRIEQLFDKPAFNHAWVSGHVVTETGEKMSKSRGTGVSPEPIVDKYGGDALRLFAAMEASHGSDIRFSEDRLRGGSKFLNKLYNIARFISMYERPNGEPTEASDQWVLNELAKVIREVTEGYHNFDPHPAARVLRNFTQEIFSSQYMELVKNRAYNRDQNFDAQSCHSARITLHLVLESVLRLFAPIIPFITDYIYRQIYSDSVHSQQLPQVVAIDETIPGDLLMAFNSAIWSFKQAQGISLRDSIEAISLPAELEPYQQDLALMHGIQSWNPDNGEKIHIFGEIYLTILN